MTFTECAECAAKPGSPDLCASCLARRADPEDLELSRLRAEVERLKERLAFKEAERKHLAAIISSRDEKRLLLHDNRVAERQAWSKTRERLEAELARANNVAAAFERERDAARAEAAAICTATGHLKHSCAAIFKGDNR